MSEIKNDRLNIESLQEIPVGRWVKWVRPYLFSSVWLLFIILFAYLAILLDYFISDGSKTFFESYCVYQANGWASFANIGFLFFAFLDYWQSHHHYQTYELQGFVLAVSIISLVLTFLLPFAITYVNDHEGTLCIRGKEASIIWVCYTMHIIYLASLLLLRGETQKVRSIEKYINSYKTNLYKK